MKQIPNTQKYVAVGTFIPAGAGDVYHEVIFIDAENRTTQTYQKKFDLQNVANYFADEVFGVLSVNPSKQLDPAIWIPTYWRKEFEGVA
jgi:hypothetical protein